ncbi:aladin [Galendromus occidentalis]|uniref:Aladin n=1 Tax=Galendromus occidentalis TaxID=34638 RepID=A0AAJ6QZ07_9ACAR|nr:aladin [Galendromus occidentalis]
MRIYTLAEFPPAPKIGLLTLEEAEGRFYNEQETENLLQAYHKDSFPEMSLIRLQDELNRPCSGPLNAKAHIIRPVTSDQLALLWESYSEHGVYGLLDHISGVQTQPLRVLALPARCALNSYHFAGHVFAFLRGLVFPQLQLSTDEICSKYSEVSMWSSGFVRAMAWHPGTKKLAIALRNDSVILYSKNCATSSELRHPKQKAVTSVAFRPFSGSQIAVGGELGLVLWNIPAAITVKTPTMHSASVLLPGRLISSLAWHPDGNVLAACSARFGDIVMISPATGEIVALTTFSFLPSAHLLRWSRDGYRIFAPSPNGGFSIWEGNPVWDAQCYASQVVTAACWSYDGCHLLYTVAGKAVVYHVSLNPVGEPMAAVPQPRPIIKLEGHPEKVSGEASLMEWDPHSQRLAIAFKANTRLIAVFKTKIKPLFDLQPLGYIRGPAIPEAMKFCEEHDEGALLSVCWSNGHVQHIKMHFEISAADRSVVLSRNAVSELSGDFSDESRISTGAHY